MDNSKNASVPDMDICAGDPIRMAGEIASRYIDDDIQNPVNPFRSPAELEASLDLDIREDGETVEQVMGALENLASATPRTTSTRFYNQLFSGRDPIATAADMLSPVINSSMYTFKAAGPMAMIERVVIGRMANALGFGEQAEGLFTPGGSISNLLALLIGRDMACPEFRNKGSMGKTMTCYASADAHYSIMKNAGIVGIGRENARKIPTDDAGRVRPDPLRQAIEDDLRDGCVPCCVIATAGTTVMGSFDPIVEMGKIAREFGIWFHVDASFGGAAVLSTKHSHLMEGVEQADSVAWNPHKVMGVPLSAAGFITREPEYLRRSLDETADYLFQADDDLYNPGTRSIQCGRRNDALKVWAAWKHHGDTGYCQRVEHLMELTQYCAQKIDDDNRFVLSCEPAYVNVCFEVNGKCSRSICDFLRERNEMLVGHAVVDGRRIIRVPIVNSALTRADIDEMLALILGAGELLPAGENAEK